MEQLIPQSRARGKRGYNGFGEQRTMHCTKYLTYIISFKSHNPVSKECYHFHLTYEESEVQRD